MAKEKIRRKLEKMSEQEIIDANYCPHCFKEKKRISRLKNYIGCKECIQCGFSICG